MAVDCPVCYEELDGKVTHTLPCQHVFCDSCMDQMVTTRGAKRKIKCAMCRERHVYQEDGSLKKDSETEDDLDGTRMLRLVRIRTRRHDGQTSLAISIIDVESMSEMIEQMHSPDDEQTNVTEVNISSENEPVRRALTDASFQVGEPIVNVITNVLRRAAQRRLSSQNLPSDSEEPTASTDDAIIPDVENSLSLRSDTEPIELSTMGHRVSNVRDSIDAASLRRQRRTQSKTVKYSSKRPTLFQRVKGFFFGKKHDGRHRSSHRR